MTSHPIAFAGMRVGLLGGSFNPAHDGHVHISRIALARLGLDVLWWLVSPQNPLKSAAPPLETRIEAARRMAKPVRRIVVTGLEARLGTVYTVDTLARLSGLYRSVRFVWVMGADSFAELHLWRNWPAIFDRVAIAVIDRPGYRARALAGPAARRFAAYRCDETDAAGLAGRSLPAWVFVTAPLSDASSTAIRRKGA